MQKCKTFFFLISDTKQIMVFMCWNVNASFVIAEYVIMKSMLPSIVDREIYIGIHQNSKNGKV